MQELRFRKLDYKYNQKNIFHNKDSRLKKFLRSLIKIGSNHRKQHIHNYFPFMFPKRWEKLAHKHV